MGADYEAVVAEYAAERDKYDALAKRLRRELEARLEARGLEVLVQARAKEVLSFAKKALRETYADPLNEIGDKTGVRVIVHYLADIPVVEEAIGAFCVVHERDSKHDALEYDKLGYLGVHCEVELAAEALGGEGERDLAGLRAEVQIHTQAQSAWAVVSHPLLYKPAVELSDDSKRGVTRLVALVELFDAEVERFRMQLEEDPAFPSQRLMAELDDRIIRFTARRPDRQLSALSVPTLAGLYPDDQSVSEAFLDPFIAENDGKLKELYERYEGDTRANPLLYQPEALLIFERMDNDPDHLVDAWPGDKLPPSLLEGLATIWGADLDLT